MTIQPNYRARWTRFISGGRAVAATVLLALMPLAAWAQDDDDKPTPLDPQSKAIQLWVFGAVAAAVLLFVIWYLLRRRATLRSGRIVEGESQSQD